MTKAQTGSSTEQRSQRGSRAPAERPKNKRVDKIRTKETCKDLFEKVKTKLTAKESDYFNAPFSNTLH